MTEHAVVVAGGGPTGLMLAAELTLAGTDVVIVERRPDQELDGSRAGGLHSRTLEVLDQRGVADRFVAEGQRHPSVGYAGIRLDIGDLPTRHNYLLALWQRDFERILAGWVLDELGVRILRERAVTGLRSSGTEVEVELSDETSLRAQYLVGCDGGRSLVRKAAGIDFPGLDPSASWMIAQVEMRDEPEIGVRPEGGGIGPVNRVEGGGPFGVVLKDPHVVRDDAPTLTDLRTALVAAYGTDFGAHRPTYISRFTDMSRQAANYRAGRVLLAGDAAHVHPPQGGQGLNTGVQDAVNLGWKLARVVAGIAPERLLDSYHEERHPVGARVLRTTEAQVALSTADDRHRALRDTMSDLLGLDEPRRRTAAMLAGLDIRLRPRCRTRRWSGDACRTSTSGRPTARRGPSRLLHDARPVLVQLRGGRRLRPLALGGSGALGRSHLRRSVGSPGPRCGRSTRGGADPPRRSRRLGRRTSPTRRCREPSRPGSGPPEARVAPNRVTPRRPRGSPRPWCPDRPAR